jgi:hypothetical protein
MTLAHAYLILSWIYGHTPDDLGNDTLPAILKEQGLQLLFLRVEYVTKGNPLIFLYQCPLSTTATEKG